MDIFVPFLLLVIFFQFDFAFTYLILSIRSFTISTRHFLEPKNGITEYPHFWYTFWIAIIKSKFKNFSIHTYIFSIRSFYKKIYVEFTFLKIHKIEWKSAQKKEKNTLPLKSLSSLHSSISIIFTKSVRRNPITTTSFTLPDILLRNFQSNCMPFRISQTKLPLSL